MRAAPGIWAGRTDSTRVESLPPGVTLQAIDGGPTYYADNGFTFAAASHTIHGVTYPAGMDDPNFFPIGLFLEKFRDAADAAKWAELNCNYAAAVQGDVDLAEMADSGVLLKIQSSEWIVDGGNNIYHATLLDNVVSIYSPDEPSTVADAYYAVEEFPCNGTPPGNTGQNNRFFSTTFTTNQVSFFDVEGVDMDVLLTDLRTTPCATERILGDVVAVDQYFYAGTSGGPWPENSNRMFNRSGDMTDDLMMRGCRYTDMMRFMRLGNANHGHPPFITGKPQYIVIETGTPYNETTTEASAIRAAQINAAVWGALIGGARYMQYFTLGDEFSWNSSGLIGSSFWDTPYNGDSISAYDQVAATNALILQLASVLNSPFAEGYLTVSPPEQPLTASLNESGYATMVKYHNRGAGADNRFYIFAIPRYGNRTHNNAGVDTGAETWPKTATFTIPNTGASQVTVINESRTISVTNGGTQFQDDFANRETVHIYRVDD